MDFEDFLRLDCQGRLPDGLPDGLSGLPDGLSGLPLSRTSRTSTEQDFQQDFGSPGSPAAGSTHHSSEWPVNNPLPAAAGVL
jgi:hypothetical protein